VSLLVKICGLSTPETVAAARDAGADMLGFVFFPKSPRHVALRDAQPLFGLARTISAFRKSARPCRIVALVVNAGQPLLDDIACELTPDFFQCHGSETPLEVAHIANDPGTPVIKALGVSTADDLSAAPAYAAAGATILIDAKPPKDAAYPGGHGKPFDWTILRGLDPGLPFMLSGGLTPETVGEAIRTVRGFGVNLVGVDVSSGVETAPGVKDVDRIRAFVAAVRQAE